MDVGTIKIILPVNGILMPPNIFDVLMNPKTFKVGYDSLTQADLGEWWGLQRNNAYRTWYIDCRLNDNNNNNNQAKALSVPL